MKKFILIPVISVSAIALLSFNQSFDLKASIARGKSVYETNCASCHMPEGDGLEGAFPPLAKSKNLTDKVRLIKIVRQGLTGPLKVNGIDYDGEMTPVQLTDQQTSDVLNFVRNSWGNKAAAILPSEIQPALKVKGSKSK